MADYNLINRPLSYYLGPEVTRIAQLAQMLNPVESIFGAMRSSQDMLAPGREPMQRVESLGDLLTGVAEAVTPVAGARVARVGADDAAQAVTEAFTGNTGQIIADAGRAIGQRLSQPGPLTATGNNTLGAFDLRPGGANSINNSAQTDPSGVRAPSMYSVDAGSRPEYLGAAPDRSDFTYLRYNPAKPSKRVADSVSALRDPKNPVRHQLLADIARGEELGGNDWYNTEELRDWFVTELGEERGDAEWRAFMHLMGAASPGSKVDPNIGNASAIRARLANDPEYVSALSEVSSLSDASKLAKGREKNYGHKTQGLQELIAARQQQGLFDALPEPGVSPAKGSWTQNPKPKGFTNSLLGNSTNIAADLHFTRYMAMASKNPDWLENVNDVSEEFMADITSRYPGANAYFKIRDVNGKRQPNFSPKKAVKDGVVPIEAIQDYPSVWSSKPNDNEYSAFESFIGELAQELGQTPAQVQANLWMGAADRTGVDPTSQGTFMEILRKRADKTAKRTGKSREEVLQNFIINNGLLAAAPITLGALLAPPRAE